jgi:outer membrane protein assembly factor BamB
MSGGGSGTAGSGSMVGGGAGSGYDVLTSHYDIARTGAQLNETILTTTNVTGAKFGKKNTAMIDNNVYGQPLVASNVMINGAPHDVVYVGTESNTVYAFDAKNLSPVWVQHLEPALPLAATGAGCGDMSGSASVVGITGTPVISRDTGLLYVVAKTMGKQMLHALDLATGKDGPGSPQAVGGAAFNSNIHLQRPGLLLLGGVVYIAFGSHCDAGGYSGQIYGHDAKTLMQVNSWVVPGGKGAIWMGGMGLASDGTSIWASIGNGSMYFNNIVKLTPMGSTLMVAAHEAEPQRGDNDLTGGVVLIGNQAITGGKGGDFAAVNQSDASLVTRLSVGGSLHNLAGWDGPAGPTVYTWPEGSPLTQWSVGAMLAMKGQSTALHAGHPGGIITISSNGKMAGTGILWANIPDMGDSWHGTAHGLLAAFDATDVTKPPLWTSAGTGDDVGTFAKFSPPTVANGNVYLATFGKQLHQFGLK